MLASATAVRITGVGSVAALNALTALWGVLASVTGPRAAIAGLRILATPLLLPRHEQTEQPGPELTRESVARTPAEAPQG